MALRVFAPNTGLAAWPYSCGQLAVSSSSNTNVPSEENSLLMQVNKARLHGEMSGEERREVIVLGEKTTTVRDDLKHRGRGGSYLCSGV